MPEQEVFHSASKSVRLSFSGGELKTKEADSSSGYAVRVLSDGRLGFAYCQQEADLDGTIEDAKRMSRFSVKSAFSFPPAAQFERPDIADLALDADGFDSLRTYVEQAKDAAASKGGKPRVVAWVENSAMKLENSAGFSGGYERTTLSLYAECMHNDGFGFSYFASNRLPADAASYGLEAAEMALAMQSAGKPDSGTYTVVMEVESLESLLDTLMPSLSGDWKRRGITKLSEGRKHFSEMLTICDDGLSTGINARPFDDEGTPSRKRVLVEGGVVKSFLYDRETAALAGVDESGACSRDSIEAPPSIGGSNLVVSAGGYKDLGDIGKYIDVHSAHGSHTANPTSGDIGLEVSTAYLVEKGKRKPVKGFMLSGNIFDMFANIEAVESRQKVYGSLIAPRIAFKDVRVVS